MESITFIALIQEMKILLAAMEKNKNTKLKTSRQMRVMKKIELNYPAIQDSPGKRKLRKTSKSLSLIL